jgi:crotonobetaine/carnitine-CoA ligase
MNIVGNRTLYSIFHSHAREQPNRCWLTYESPTGELSQWTFADFLETVHQTVNLLQSYGIGTGDVVSLHLANHPAFPQVILAASYIGAIVLPTIPSSSVEEFRYFLEHSEAKLVITETIYLGKVEAAAKNRRCLILSVQGEKDLTTNYRCYETELAQQSSLVSRGDGSTDKVVQLLYTSGTTSVPKGVILTNANFVYGSEVFRAATGLRYDDHHLIALPLYHAAAHCHALWPSVITGCSVSILSRFSASRFFEQAARHEATMAALFAAPLRMLLNQPARPTDRIHRLRNVTYAQNITPSQCEEWRRRFDAPLQQLWGMTETCGLPIMSPLTGTRRLSAMGRPVLGYEIKIVDESGREVPPQQAGELIVRGIPGHSLMNGYLKNTAATTKAMRQMQDGTWLFTGDTAMYDTDGFIYFLDRSNDLIKRGGENISTIEVESVIAGLAGVADVCVVGLPDSIRDEIVAAVVVSEPDVKLTSDQIYSHCAARLAAYKIPERVEFMEALPQTSVGKIRKDIVRNSLLGLSGPDKTRSNLQAPSQKYGNEFVVNVPNMKD